MNGVEPERLHGRHGGVELRAEAATIAHHVRLQQ
jgi:hypothetical protein